MWFNLYSSRHISTSVRLFSSVFLIFSLLCMTSANAQQKIITGAQIIYHFANTKIPLAEFVNVDIQSVRYNPDTGFSRETALHLAVKYDDVSAATILLERGADVNAASYIEPSDAGSPLHYARSVEMAQLLLNNGAKLNSQAIYDKTTPIQEALVRQDKEVVNFFLEQGADLNAGAVKDKDCFYFISQGMVWFLFDSIVPFIPLTMWSPAETFVFSVPVIALAQHITDLQNAGYLTLSQAVGAFMIGGAVSWFTGVVAAQTWRDKIQPHVKALLRKLNIPPTKAENMPLNTAISSKDTEIIDMFLNNGADVNGQGSDLKQPLVATIFAYRDNEDAGLEQLRALIDAGADINKKYDLPFYTYEYYDKDKFKRYSFTSALDLARSLGCSKMVEFLLDNGADDDQDPPSEVDFDSAMFDKVDGIEHDYIEPMQKLKKHLLKKHKLKKPQAYRTSQNVKQSQHRMFKAPTLMPATQLR